VLLASVAFAASAPGRAQAAPMLVENGRAAAEIVTAGQPARMARLAAEELQASSFCRDDSAKFSPGALPLTFPARCAEA